YVERNTHPLEYAGLLAYDYLLSIECVFRKFFEQRLRVQFLCAYVDLEFDVVLGGLIYLHRFLEVVPQHFAGGAGRFDGGVEIMPHERLARTKRKKCTRKTNRFCRAFVAVAVAGGSYNTRAKKNREEK